MKLMTTAEVAEYLRLKERTVYEMATKRQIPCTRATGKLLFSRRLIERWIESRTELPTHYDATPPPIYAGSSDPLLEWALRESGSGLALLTSGSLTGLRALAQGQATMAGAHLLEDEQGSYNVATIPREVPYPDVVAIEWARREQGLLVPAGNPLGLRDMQDLLDKQPRTCLRPEGTGTWTLFQALVARAGLDAGALNLLPRPAQTEGDLATAILEGEADCGPAIRAVAKRGGLDFVPLGVEERFDLVMRRRDYFEPPIQALLSFVRSGAFGQRADSLGGYDISRLGTVVYNG